MNISKLDKKQTKFIMGLGLDDLKKYVDNLSNQYYVCISKGEIYKTNTILETFKKIIEIHEDTNIESYINYSLSKTFNDILFKSVDNCSGLTPIIISEPVLLTSDNQAPFIETKLEKVVKHFETEKAFKYMDELKEKLKTEEDVKKYFHYYDYV